jgi:hypothetical protein
MKGYYLMSRGWMDHPLFNTTKPFSKREAWVWIIERAAYAEYDTDVVGTIRTVERGSFYCSVRELAKYWNWTKAAVQRYLEKLKINENICLKSGTGKTLIYVMNYDTYQVPESASGTEAVQKRYTSGTNRKKINKTNKTNTNVVPEFFREQFTSNYPRRKTGYGITAVYKKIEPRVRNGEVTWDDFFLACKNYKKNCERNQTSPEYVKMGTTFVTSGSFLDFITVEEEKVIIPKFNGFN